jgi:hypothetical protein
MVAITLNSALRVPFRWACYEKYIAHPVHDPVPSLVNVLFRLSETILQIYRHSPSLSVLKAYRRYNLSDVHGSSIKVLAERLPAALRQH